MASETDDHSSSSPNKRLKTLIPQIKSELPDPVQPEPQPESQNSPPERCVICFLDYDKAPRGKIDCCDHYFCFLCIKIWAKTESKCPICRRRFSTIRRPPKHGVFARERVVKVPVRDQGDISVQLDAYEDVVCNVCSSMSDDHFMLLCDSCDGAAHSYCVGLGYTVPEGDWYCSDCIASRPELADMNGVNDYCEPIPTETVPVPYDMVLDIVRESSRSVVERPPTANQPLDLPSSFVPRAARQQPILPPRAARISAESAARTLDRCRNVQTRILTMRENWNGFRSGALSFPACSSTANAGGSGSQERHNGYDVVCGERSAQAQPSSSPSRQQLEHCDDFDSYDVDRAWKMLERARKPKPCVPKRSSSGVQLLQFSELPSSRTGPSMERSNAISSPSLTTSQQQSNQVGSGSRDVDRAWKMMDRVMLEQHSHKNTSIALKKLPIKKAKASEEVTNFVSISGIANEITSSSLKKLPIRKAKALEKPTNVCSSSGIVGSRQLGAPNQGRVGLENAYKGKEMQSRIKIEEPWDSWESILDFSYSNSAPGVLISPFANNVNRSASSQENEASLFLFDERDGSGPSTMRASSQENEASLFLYDERDWSGPSTMREGASYSYSIKLEHSTSSSGNLEESKARKADDKTKSEIQSLVKMNLKLLTKDQRIQIDAFKKIARAATHTVLAACGLEHRHESAIHSFPSLVCRHTEDLPLPIEAKLMHNACRDCFVAFVKGVLTSILHNHDGF